MGPLAADARVDDLASLPEEMALLIWAPTEQTLLSRHRSRTVAMAALGELVLRERLAAVSARRSLLAEPRLVITDETPTGDSALDRALGELIRHRRGTTTDSTATSLASWTGDVYAERLQQREVLWVTATPRRKHTPKGYRVAPSVLDVLDVRLRDVLAAPDEAQLREVALAAIAGRTRALAYVLARLDPAYRRQPLDGADTASALASGRAIREANAAQALVWRYATGHPEHAATCATLELIVEASGHLYAGEENSMFRLIGRALRRPGSRAALARRALPPAP